MQNENKKRNLWIWLIPVYIIVAIPIVRLTIKLSSPDIPLSKDDMAAFSGTASKVGNLEYQRHEPDFSDLDYAISYKTQGSSLEEEDYYDNLQEKEKTYVAKSGKEQGKQIRTEQQMYSSQNNQQQYKANELQQQQMMSVGFRKGFLTNAVASLINNPKQVAALFNNSFVVKGFMSRDSVKNNLSSPQALENYLTKTNAVNTFLNNSIVQTALKNPQVVSAVAGSSLGAAILNSPAVQGLLKEPDKINSILNSNPQLGMLLANPNITSALMNNPDTAKVFMQIQGSGNIPNIQNLPKFPANK